MTESRVSRFSIAVAVLLLTVAFSGIARAQTYSEGSKTLTVYGMAKMTVRPDIAYFAMDISTTAAIIDDAYEENLMKVENTINKLKKLGVKESWIKVYDSELYKIEPYNMGEAVIFGISNVVLVTIPDIDKLKKNDLRKKVFEISQAVSRTTITPYASTSSPGAGRISTELSNTIGYYGHLPAAIFGITTHGALEEKLLRDAIEDARREAEKQAKVLGVTIKDITYFYQTFPYNKACGTSGSENGIFPEGPVSSDPNSITLCTTVNVVYSFE
jgi:uncharacterized protein YggE